MNEHLGDDYIDPQEIGRGASSIVYRARSVTFDRDVAVKVFVAGGRADGRQARLFQRECAMVGRVSSHPHIVTVFDGRITRQGLPYLAMEYFDRGSLATHLTGQGPLAPAVAVTVGVRVADALVAAHAAGVRHRDVKPQNVLWNSHGVVALADFGVAVPAAVEVTSFAATPSYAAPEVLHEPAAAGDPADIYSLAATVYALLTGRPPFVPAPGQSPLRYLGRILSEPVPPLPAGVPRPVAEVVLAGLAKAPADRPASARALEAALRAAADAAGLPVFERLPAAGPAPRSGPSFGGLFAHPTAAQSPDAVFSEATSSAPLPDPRREPAPTYPPAPPPSAVDRSSSGPHTAPTDAADPAWWSATRTAGVAAPGSGTSGVRPPGGGAGTAKRRRVLAGAAAVGGLLAVATAAVLLHRGGAPRQDATVGAAPTPPTTPPPSVIPRPYRLQVVDQGSSAVLTWADPYAGQMRYVVEYGAGAKLVADSSTRTVVSGLSPGRGYCFAVGVPIVTAEAGARVVLSDPVCIRGASTAPSVSAP